MGEDFSITSKQYEIIANIKQKVLEMLVTDTSVTDILNMICSMVESTLSNTVASIVIKDSSSGLLSIKSPHLLLIITLIF